MPLDEGLEFSLESDGGIGVVSLWGRLVAETRHELGRALRDWEESGPSRVAIDLSGVEYVDSAGLAALLGAWKRLRGAGGDLVLAGVNPRVESIFRVSSIERILRVFPAKADAREHLAALPPPTDGASAREDSPDGANQT